MCQHTADACVLFRAQFSNSLEKNHRRSVEIASGDMCSARYDFPKSCYDNSSEFPL